MESSKLVDQWIAASSLWLWRDAGAASMAVARSPMYGVVRLSIVFTPPELRRRGYAEACVHALSQMQQDAGYRCVLYADLVNATSNAIYRRIGYRAVGEGLHYRFDCSLPARA